MVRKPRKNSKLFMDPPQMQTQPVFHRKLRFVSVGPGATQDKTLTSLDLFAALGCVSTGSFQGACLAYTAKVKRISIWCTPKSDSDGAWQHVAIDWHNSTSFASGKKVSDVSISNARPAYVTSTPPEDSVCNLWMQGTNIQYATITVPLGSIVDIDVSFTLPDQNPHVQTITGVQPVGIMFYGYLDESTGGYLQPTDLYH